MKPDGAGDSADLSPRQLCGSPDSCFPVTSTRLRNGCWFEISSKTTDQLNGLLRYAMVMDPGGYRCVVESMVAGVKRRCAGNELASRDWAALHMTRECSFFAAATRNYGIIITQSTNERSLRERRNASRRPVLCVWHVATSEH